MAQSQTITQRNSGPVEDKSQQAGNSVNFADHSLPGALFPIASKNDWPFTTVKTVSTTNLNADYSTIQAAIDSVAAGQVVTIVLDRETFTENITINSKSVYLFGFIYGAPKFGMTTVLAGTVTVSSSTGNATFLAAGLSITGAVSGDTGATANSIGMFLTRCSLFSAGSTRVNQNNRTSLTIDNCYVSYTGGNAIAGTITSSQPTIIRNSIIEGGISLSGAVLSVDAASWPYTYSVSAGTINILNNVISGGVWRQATGGRVVRETDLATAITNAATGDTIILYPGTYTGPFTINKSIAIIGTSPNEVILTLGTNSSTTVTVTTTGVTLANLTINHTGGGTGGICFANDQNGCLLQNVYLNHTSGGGTTSAALNIFGGTGTGTTLIDVFAVCTSGTAAYAISAGAALNLYMIGGSLNGTTKDIITAPSANVFLRWPKLLGGGIDVSAGGSVTGAYVNATQVNVILQVGVAVYNSGTQALTTATDTVLTFDSERRDDAGFHSTSSNTGRLTVPTGFAGWYQISGSVEFAANATGNRQVSISLNGTTPIALQTQAAPAAGNTDMTVSTGYYLNAADYVELKARQTSGGNLNSNVNANYSPEFRMFRVG